MIFFLLPYLAIITLYLIGNLFSFKLKLNSYEKPLYGLVFTILTLNYLYFWLDLELHTFSMLYLSLTIIGFLVSLFSIKITLKEILRLFLVL